MTLVSKAFSDIVTFSRSSNATRIGPNGLVQYAPHNLILQSQTFDNASWTKNAATVTANSTAAPDGTITADRLIPNSGTNSFTVVNQGVSITNGLTYAISIYVKKDAFRYFYIYADGAPLNYGQARADLDTGTIITGTGSVTSVGNGWFRFTGIFNAVAGGTSFIFLGATNSSSTFSTTGDGVTGTYIWGAQLAVGPLALDYTPTTTAAVYGPRFDYDGSGVTSVDPIARNLLTYSEQFDNAAWNPQASIVTANAGVAPDGVTSADKIAANNTSAPHAIFNASALTLTASIYTWSIFVKAAGNNFANLTAVSPNGGARYAIAVDLTTGTVTQTASSGTPTNTSSFVSSYGNGWYRIGISMTASSSGSASYLVAIGIPTGTPTRDATSLDPQYTGNGTDGILIWGAQLELGSTATGYMVSGATNGFRAVPVVSGSATARGLLVEEQRTNLVTYSEQFDNAAWPKNAVTVTADATASPDGTVNADHLVTTAANSDINRPISVAADSATYTASIFVKYVSGSTTFRLRAALTGGTSVAKYLRVNAQTGAYIDSDSTYSITSVGNGWYRLTLTITNNGTNSTFAYQIFPTDSTSSTNTMAVWGAQLEAGSFATSYIPTVASTVTRSADVARVNTLSPWFNATEGTLFGEGEFISSGATATGLVALGDGTSNENIGIYKASTSISAEVLDGGAPQASYTQPVTGQIARSAFAYKANDFNCATNGTVGTTDTSGTLPTVTTMFLGAIYSGTSYPMNGRLRRIAYYPRRLTNAELQALTA